MFSLVCRFKKKEEIEYLEHQVFSLKTEKCLLLPKKPKEKVLFLMGFCVLLMNVVHLT